MEFRDFISICLRPEGGTRKSAQQLLEHPFSLKYVELDKKLLKKWIKALWLLLNLQLTSSKHFLF